MILFFYTIFNAQYETHFVMYLTIQTGCLLCFPSNIMSTKNSPNLKPCYHFINGLGVICKTIIVHFLHYK